jgi:hypothetical protein
MLSINRISLKIKTTFSAIRSTFSLWLDDGSGAINNPWNDSDTWSE